MFEGGRGVGGAAFRPSYGGLKAFRPSWGRCCKVMRSHRQTDRQTGRQTDRQADRYTYIHAYIWGRCCEVMN